MKKQLWLKSGVAAAILLGTTVTSLKADYSAVVLADNPVHYWRLLETEVTQPAADAGTRGGQDGTYTGGITLDESAAPSLLPGAAHFDGQPGTYVDLGLFHPGDSMTVEAWVNMDLDAPAGTWHAIVARWDGSFEIDIAGNDHANFVWRNDQNEFGVVASAAPVVRGQWNHVIGIFDAVAGAATIYVNGVQGGTAATTGVLQNAGPDPDRVLIGGTRSGSEASFNWKGLIAEVAIYDYGLSEEQVWNHYDAAIPEVPEDVTRVPAVSLSWTAMPGFILYRSHDVAAEEWFEVPAPPVVDEGTARVSLAADEDAEFFRLVRP